MHLRNVMSGYVWMEGVATTWQWAPGFTGPTVSPWLFSIGGCLFQCALVNIQKAIEHGPFIAELPMVIFHSYVSLPEGSWLLSLVASVTIGYSPAVLLSIHEIKLNKASGVGHCLHQSLQMSTAMHLQCTVRTVPFQHLPTKIGPAIPIPLPKSKEHLPNEPYPFLVIPWPGGAPAPVRLGRFLRSRWCGGCHQH